MSSVSDNATDRLENGNIRRLLKEYSWPAIVGMIVVSLYNIVDRIYIGQGVGPMAISGLTLTFPISSLIAAIGTLVGVGASARLSIVLGMKDVKWARNILGNAFIMTFVLSAVFVTLSMVFLDDLLRLFGGTDNTIPYARDYLNIVLPGSVLSNLTFNFSNMIRASGNPKKAMYTLSLGVLLNVALDPVFIFWLDMGIKGAAVATVISMFISAIFALSHFLDRSRQVHFTREGMKLKKYIIRNIVSIGMAPFLMNVASSAVNIIMNTRLVVYGGDLAIGAYGIINSYATFVVMCVMGLGQGMQPIVGYNYGAQRLKRMKDVLLLAIRWSFVVMIGGFLLAELFPKAMVRAFTTDPELTRMTVEGMRIVFLMIPIVGFQIIVSTFFQSISKPGKAVFMSLSRQVLFLIPLLYLLSSIWGLKGIWFSIPVSDLAASLIGVVFLIRERKVFYPRTLSRA